MDFLIFQLIGTLVHLVQSFELWYELARSICRLFIFWNGQCVTRLSTYPR